MIGAQHLADSKVDKNTWIYTCRFASSSYPFSRNEFTNEYIWEKPKGINFVYGLVIGPGSGGGGGGTLGGGGGGSTGAMLQFLQPASLVPDRLLILVGSGGAGGAGGNPSGANGGYPLGEHGIYYLSSAYTGIESAINRKNYAKSNQVHTGTQSGRGGTNAAAGAGGAIPSTTFCPGPGTLGVSSYTLLAGNVGLNGGLNTAGTNAQPASTGPCQGGAGGGGRSGGARTGGNVTNWSTITWSAQTIYGKNAPGGVASGAPGSDGITIFEPAFYTSPGAGGAANDAGTGGRGGNGGIGCGGGGGGAGSTGGGAGGNGGDGIVILTCW